MKKQLQILALIPLAFDLLEPIDNQNLINPYLGEHVISQKEMSLDDRYSNDFVNEVFKNNILLNLAYLRGNISFYHDIKWDEITKPFQYKFKLDPNRTFAFHEDVEKKYQDTVEKTTNAHFNFQEGFKTDGYLFGDGVCHLASLIYWAAKEAELEAEAPTNHDFMKIPDIPKEYGVSIYNHPSTKESNAKQNLYVTNNKGKPITFKFEYDGQKVKVSIAELN